MSLRAFHLSFITLAIVVFLGTSIRSFQLSQMETAFPFQSMAGASLFLAITLTAYASWCLRKRSSPLRLFAIATVAVLLGSSSALGCATCYGDPNSAMVQASNQGGFFLLATAVVGVGLLGWRLASWAKQSETELRKI